ncbi:hypothetical protein [uncultured Dysgonomonas sp.]|uniref:Uncharacterized protein n=1 Tax=uncultured Dysgonomonas sp. TaxID=206096 RepID=A0A212ITR7_9BACT|nr:hypothetical protein [uncultured Dysgonomonas sp.]SBV90582.1 conserved hypothetical protein [uncultured Dysgonomonas sp.]
MALWQYTFNLVPENTIKDKVLIDEDGYFDTSPLWLKSCKKINIFEDIGILLPLSESWDTDIVQYGDLNSNCIEIYKNQNFIESASFRINFLSNYKEILKEIIRICFSEKLLILDEFFNVVPYDFDKIYSVIENSQQKKYYMKLIQ